jgi:hypothetical protein
MINGAHAILYSDDAEVTRAALAKLAELSGPPSQDTAGANNVTANSAVEDPKGRTSPAEGRWAVGGVG